MTPGSRQRLTTNDQRRFYERILDTTLAREDMGPMRMGVFPHEKPLPTGAVVHGPGYEPASQGSVVPCTTTENMTTTKTRP